MIWLLHRLEFSYKKPKLIPGKLDSAKQEECKVQYRLLKEQLLTIGFTNMLKLKFDFTNNDIISQELYSSKDINSLLKYYLPNDNIEEVFLFQLTGDHVRHNVINTLKIKLKGEIKDKVVSGDKFYILIEQTPNNDQQLSSVILLKLYKKNDNNQIKILPVVGLNSGFLLGALENTPELNTVPIKLDSLPQWFRKYQDAKTYLSNIIEVIKLSIEYKKPCKVSNDKINEIMNTPYVKYEKLHRELLDQLKSTYNEEIDEASTVENKNKKASATVKKTVHWNSSVRDNEGKSKIKRIKR